MFLGCSRTLYILQAWLTLPSCLASSNKPTFPLIIFWSLVIVGVLIKRRGRALRNPASSAPGLGSRFGLMTPNVRSNINYYSFAHLKTHHGFERMRLRGLSGARDEFHLAAIVQNL